MKEKEHTLHPQIPDEFELAGLCHDTEGRLIGRYIFLWHPSQQEILDRFCRAWLETHKQNNKFYLTRDYETQGLDPYTCRVILSAVSWDNDNSLVFVPDNFDLTLYKEVLKTIPINNHNNKFDARFDKIRFGVRPRMNFCTMTAARVAWAGVLHKFDLAFLVDRFLDEIKVDKGIRMDFVGMVPEVDEEGITRWKGENKNQPSLNPDHVKYAAQDSMLTHRLVVPIASRLEETNLWNIWEKLECPLLNYLTDFEVDGLAVNWKFVNDAFDKLEKELYDLEVDMRALIRKSFANYDKVFTHPSKPKVKPDFNPRARDHILKLARHFGIMLPDTRKDTLLALQTRLMNTEPRSKEQEAMFVILNKMLEYKEKATYISKFVNPWIKKLRNPMTKRVHPTINVITSNAQTGRMSARDPNIMAVTGDFRPAIVADPGWQLIIRDYSQFEFRAAAGFAREETMLGAFREREELMPKILDLSRQYEFEDPDTFVKKAVDIDLTPELRELVTTFMGTDIHRKNASGMFGMAPHEVTGELRSIAKTLGYTVLYGGHEDRVQEALAKEGKFYSLNECSKFIKKFYESLPNLKAFLETLRKSVLDPGYIRTPMGRKKFFELPEKWRNDYSRTLLDFERQAANAMQQSSNADATKLAMVLLIEAFEDYPEDERPKVLFPVHDELIVTAPDKYAREVFDLVGDLMVEAGGKSIKFSCPIEVSGQISPHWIK